jgi:hypothetical protein
MPGSVVVLTADDSDPRDPMARCDRCGALGTIARAIRHSEPPLIVRYCGPCWPLASAEIEERKHEEAEQWQKAKRARPGTWGSNSEERAAAPPSPTAWTIASRSWYDVRGFLALLAQPTKGGPGVTPQHLAAIAAEIRAGASVMDGPIPSDGADFLERHTQPPF